MIKNNRSKIYTTLDKYSGYDLDMDLDVFINQLTDIKNRFKNNYEKLYIEGMYEDGYGDRPFLLLIKGERYENDEEYEERISKIKETNNKIREKEIKQLRKLQEKYGKDA